MANVWGFHKWGYPKSWMVKRENPNLKWMMTGGTPIVRTNGAVDAQNVPLCFHLSTTSNRSTCLVRQGSRALEIEPPVRRMNMV